MVQKGKKILGITCPLLPVPINLELNSSRMANSSIFASGIFASGTEGLSQNRTCPMLRLTGSTVQPMSCYLYSAEESLSGRSFNVCGL